MSTGMKFSFPYTLSITVKVPYCFSAVSKLCTGAVNQILLEAKALAEVKDANWNQRSLADARGVGEWGSIP